MEIKTRGRERVVQMENIELEVIESLFFDLIRKIAQEEGKWNEEINHYYRSQNWEDLKSSIEEFENIIQFKETLYNILESSINNLNKTSISQNNIFKNEKISLQEFFDEKDRKHKIRIKTEKTDQTYYSNILTLELFENIIDKTIKYLGIVGYVKTNLIAKELKETIQEESGYQKSSTLRVPIYAVYKYFLSEGILDYSKDNKHKYIYKSKDGKKYLINLKNKIKNKENITTNLFNESLSNNSLITNAVSI
jgi:hypothetical protein